MKKLHASLLAIVVLVTSSCSSTGLFQKRQNANAFCPSSALVEMEEYTIEGPADKSRRAFELWVNDLATKYPKLYLAQSQLQECWKHYHGES